MKRETWKPIREDGSIDEDELRRPADTLEPTTWEVELPPFGQGQSRVANLIFAAAISHGRHRFWVLTSGTKSLPEWEWSSNITVAVGPIRTQAEADAAIPALFAVKAARREAVFAPMEVISLRGRVWSPTPCHHCGSRRGDAGRGECGPLDKLPEHAPGEIPMIHAIRVRGGATAMLPEHVRALHSQTVASVDFSIAWGEWVPIGQLPPGTPFGDAEMRCPLGRVGGVYAKLGDARSGCTLDGVDYPEVSYG